MSTTAPSSMAAAPSFSRIDRIAGFTSQRPNANFPAPTERWLSGLKYPTRNRTWGQTHRGFESHPLRHSSLRCPKLRMASHRKSHLKRRMPFVALAKKGCDSLPVSFRQHIPLLARRIRPLMPTVHPGRTVGVVGSGLSLRGRDVSSLRHLLDTCPALSFTGWTTRPAPLGMRRPATNSRRMI